MLIFLWHDWKTLVVTLTMILVKGSIFTLVLEFPFGSIGFSDWEIYM